MISSVIQVKVRIIDFLLFHPRGFNEKLINSEINCHLYIDIQNRFRMDAVKGSDYAISL